MQLHRHRASSTVSSRNSSNGGVSISACRQHPQLASLHHRHHHRFKLNTRRPAAAPGPSQPDAADLASTASRAEAAAAAAAAAPLPAAAAAPTAAAAAAAGPDPAVAKARQELSDSWQQLKDAAGTAFVPGHKQRAAAVRRLQPLSYSDLLQEMAAARSGTQQQQQQQQQDDEIQSVPDRLRRLFTGEFIREREASRVGGRQADQQQQQQQQVDPRVAAVQFEVLQGLQQQQQQGQAQQQQQQQPDAGVDGAGSAAAAAAAPPPPPAAAAAVTVDAEGIIDVTPATPSAAAAAEAGAAAADPSAATATSPPPSSAAAESQPSPQQGDQFPASTQVLVVCIWAVFVLQWVPMLPELWGMAASGAGGLANAAAALLLAFPDTPVTNALCLSLPALQSGAGWHGLLTSSLCNSGLAATWLCSAALQTSGRWLEVGTGQLQLLTIFLLCSLAASGGHLFAGRCALGVCGPGTVLGVYTAWTIVATRYMRDAAPLKVIYAQGLLLLGLLLGLGLLQPAVSAGSLFGGMLGGAVAVAAVGPVSEVLRWCLALPAMLVLLLLRMGLDLLLLLWTGLVFVAAAAWQLGRDLVGTVRRL